VVGSISVGREGERGGKRGEFARSCELKRKQGTEEQSIESLFRGDTHA
jgi:hypothetical protein